VFKRVLFQFLSISLISGLLIGCSNQEISVTKIYDGDTILTSSGSKIRLLQIDTPELATKECHAEESKVQLESFLATSLQSLTFGEIERKNLAKIDGIRLEADSNLDSEDRYGRKLSYLFVGKLNINIEMVKIGAATPYFYQGEKGKYSIELEEAAEYAKQNQLGVWADCPGFVYNPVAPITTGSSSSQYIESTDDDSNGGVGGFINNSQCSPDYRECVPPYPPDLDCGNLVALGLIHVIGTDPHRLDRDGDGLACESNAN